MVRKSSFHSRPASPPLGVRTHKKEREEKRLISIISTHKLSLSLSLDSVPPLHYCASSTSSSALQQQIFIVVSTLLLQLLQIKSTVFSEDLFSSPSSCLLLNFLGQFNPQKSSLFFRWVMLISCLNALDINGYLKSVRLDTERSMLYLHLFESLTG